MTPEGLILNFPIFLLFHKRGLMKFSKISCEGGGLEPPKPPPLGVGSGQMVISLALFTPNLTFLILSNLILVDVNHTLFTGKSIDLEFEVFFSDFNYYFCTKMNRP